MHIYNRYIAYINEESLSKKLGMKIEAMSKMKTNIFIVVVRIGKSKVERENIEAPSDVTRALHALLQMRYYNFTCLMLLV